uniref:TAXi_C domain-containing protein n=1 Tax=Heterorhabditis bacteriophora TaxID=37862 RepID=A0A1I7XPN5_HETBA
MWMQKIYPHDDERPQTTGDINLKTRFITAGTSRYIYFITERSTNARIIEDGFHVFDLWTGTSSKYFVDGDSLISEFYEMAAGCGSAIVEDDVSFEVLQILLKERFKFLIYIYIYIYINPTITVGFSIADATVLLL